MKSPWQSPVIKRATMKAHGMGFRVEFAAYLESAATHGFLGQIAGLCDLNTQPSAGIRSGGSGVFQRR